MKTLVEKEIRLLLPAFAAALVLAILPVWLLPAAGFEYGENGAFECYLFLLGIVLLALSSFGREIGLKTIPFALAQPLERTRLWWTKVEVLAVFLGLTFDAWLLSDTLCSSLQPVRVVPPHELAFYGVTVIVLTAGALWMTLLLRQVVAALFLTVLIPLAAGIAIQALSGEDWMSITVFALYSVTGFFLARRQFLRIQDTAWTGGLVSLGSGRAATEKSALRREYDPWAALFRKELQLQQFTLAGMAALFVLHLGIILLRKAGANTFNHTILSALEEFGVIWLFMPLLAGSQSVAEERQLGTLDPLLCLPVGRRVQFGVKLMFVLVIGGLLSAALLSLAEGIAGAVGAWANLYVLGTQFKGFIGASFLFMLLSLVGFYASTLARGLVPALAVGMVSTILFWMIQFIASHAFPAFGLHLWPLMGPPTLLATVLWLAYGNFRWVFESGRRWRRNLLGLFAVLLLVCGSASALYHRVWEWAMPSEPAHGPARILAGKPALIRADDFSLAIVLPDGRLCVQRKDYIRNRGWNLVNNHFIAGSNWVDAIPFHGETVGIQTDGTLWVSQKNSSSAELVQYGSETDWQSLDYFSFQTVILLKKDGTLWHWGPEAFDKDVRQKYQGLRSLAPVRLGANSDWARLVHGLRYAYAWKQDGSAWNLHEPYENGVWVNPPSQVELAPHAVAVPVPALDHIYFQSMARCPDNQIFGLGQVGVRDDGTLWYWNAMREWPMSRSTGLSLAPGAALPGLVQIGKDTNWKSVTSGIGQLLALKTDGSIWQWKLDTGPTQLINGRWVQSQTSTPPKSLLQSPVRLGTHSDWVALNEIWGEPLTLSADGTLWHWPSPDWRQSWSDDSVQWLAPSRRPVKIENILDAPQ